MRLLNVHTLELETFKAPSIPPYAIASHRWSCDETSFQEISRRDLRSHGAEKLKVFCNFVIKHPPARPIESEARNSIRWLWADTCCINKEYTAELSASINSMCQWYKQSHYCIAYLEDIEPSRNPWTRSEWFSRGWTLQELLAPKCILFIDRGARIIGHKCGRSSGRPNGCFGCQQGAPNLNRDLSRLTNIPVEVLYDFEVCKRVPPKQRLQWIDGRRTTRPEDMTYSLFGIFDVFMPVLYGEGHDRARQRFRKIVNRREKGPPDELELAAMGIQHIPRRSAKPWQEHLELSVDIIMASAPRGLVYCVVRHGTEMVVATDPRRKPQRTFYQRLKGNYRSQWLVRLPIRDPIPDHHSVTLMLVANDDAVKALTKTSSMKGPSPENQDLILDVIGESSLNLLRDLEVSLSRPIVTEKQFRKILYHGGRKVGEISIACNYQVYESRRR